MLGPEPVRSVDVTDDPVVAISSDREPGELSPGVVQVRSHIASRARVGRSPVVGVRPGTGVHRAGQRIGPGPRSGRGTIGSRCTRRTGLPLVAPRTLRPWIPLWALSPVVPVQAPISGLPV